MQSEIVDDILGKAHIMHRTRGDAYEYVHVGGYGIPLPFAEVGERMEVRLRGLTIVFCFPPPAREMEIRPSGKNEIYFIAGSQPGSLDKNFSWSWGSTDFIRLSDVPGLYITFIIRMIGCRPMLATISFWERADDLP